MAGLWGCSTPATSCQIFGGKIHGVPFGFDLDVELPGVCSKKSANRRKRAQTFGPTWGETVGGTFPSFHLVVLFSVPSESRQWSAEEGGGIKLRSFDGHSGQ